MRRSRFTERQIAFALHRAEAGTPVAEVCRKMGISEPTHFRWKKRYGGPMPSEARKLRQLEEENARLRRLVSDLSLDTSEQGPRARAAAALGLAGRAARGRQ